MKDTDVLVTMGSKHDLKKPLSKCFLLTMARAYHSLFSAVSHLALNYYSLSELFPFIYGRLLYFVILQKTQ